MSWRVMQYVLGGCGTLAFLAVWFFLPETSHPGARGIDQLHESIASDDIGGKGMGGLRRRGVVWINPLASLWLLRSPNLFAVVRLIFHVLLPVTPLPHILGLT